MNNKRVYVTLLSSDDFVVGVVMLNWSLQRVRASYPLLVLCAEGLSNETLSILKKHKISYRFLTEHIVVDTSKVNTTKGYDHWNRTFDKLMIWSLEEFNKVVCLDSDMQIIRNIDYLFEKPHMSAVIADQWNEPGLDKLNSGLIVIKPNLKEFEGLKDVWESGQIKLNNVGDQDVIRAYYKDWGEHKELILHPGLNVLYSEVSAGIIKKQNVHPVSVIHYIGSRKPWMVSIFALFKRLKHNFLWKYFFQYAMNMYVRFPICILPKKYR